MAHLAISLLGTVKIARDTTPIIEFTSNKVRALLAYLAVESSHSNARETLAGLLWPESPESAALASLRNALASLRRAIGDRDADPPYLLITNETVQFNRGSDYDLDIEDLLRFVDDSHHLPFPCHPADIACRTAAVGRYCGPFLTGLSVPESAAFEEWACLWRERLARLVLEELRWLADYYEGCGEYSQALEYARRQLALEPWLEEGYRQVMRILALSGQRSAALAQYEICRPIIIDELNVEPVDETQRLYDTIRHGDLDRLHPRRILPVPGEPPYRGMHFFDELDAANFFGREALTARLVERVKQMTESSSPQLAVVGASGSGKSSLVRAGVAPALRKLGWNVEVITPSAYPLHAFGSLEGKGLLVIDQFEELFSLCNNECEREAFLEKVFGSGQPALLVLRVDFYGHCASYPLLRAVLSTCQEYIGAMDADGLRRAIEEPARQAGWELEPGLANLILRDVGVSGDHSPEPGGLPLLEHALLETWLCRRGRVLTLEGYAESGGVRGAIAQTAERVYTRLSPENQNLARKVFLRLTELGESTLDSRRRAAFSELRALGGSGQAVDGLLNILAEARLVTLGEETAEVAHEALIREWPALQGWLAEDRDGLRLHRHLTESAAAWNRLGRDEGDLYHGARLARALEWVQQAEHGLDLTSLEREFLQSSQEREEREAQEREAQRQRELESARRLAEERTQAADRLNRQERRAYARELAAHSKSKLTTEPDLSLLLALQAVAVLNEAGLPVPWDVQQAIHDVALTSRLLWRKSDVGTNMALFAPDGRRVYSEHYIDVNDEKVYALDAETGEILFWIPSDGVSFDVMPDGKYLATANGGQACLWDARTGEKILTIPLPCPDNPYRGSMNAVSPDGRYLQVNSDSDTGQLIDLKLWFDSGSLPGVTLDLPMKRVDRCSWAAPSVTFSPDGKTFTTGWDKDFSVTLWDTEVVQPIRTFAGHTGLPRIASFSPDGSRLATCSFDNTIRLWDVASARELMCFAGHTLGIHAVIYSPDGKQLASTSNDGKVILWDAENGQQIRTMYPGGASYMASFHPDGQRLFVSSFSRLVSMWDVSRHGRGELANIPYSGSIVYIGCSLDRSLIIEGRADGSIVLRNSFTFREVARMVVGLGPCNILLPCLSWDNTHLAVDIDGQISVWDVQSGKRLFSRPAEDQWDQGFAFAPAFSPDGTLLVTGGYSEKITVWNLVTGQKQRVLTIRPGSPPTYCQFSPDGRRLAVGAWGTIDSGGGITWVWNLAEPEKLPLVINTDKYAFQALWFNPDSRSLACCGNEIESRVWDANSGQCQLTLSGHSGFVVSIQYSPDGRYLVTASTDGTVRVWDAYGGAELLCYVSPSDSAYTLAFFTPDSRRVVACSSDDCYRLLAFLDFDELLEIVRKRATRDWKPEERCRYLRQES